MASKPFIIRKFRPSDQAEVRQLYRETVAANSGLYYRPLSGPQLPDDVAANFSHENDAFYVATIDEKIVGFCGLRTLSEDRSAASFVNGMVVSEFRGLGIYKAMFQHREAEALGKGIRTFLAITSSQNVKMREHLLRSGFELFTPEVAVPGFLHLKRVVDLK